MVILMELVSPSGRWAGVFYHSSPKTPTAYGVSLLSVRVIASLSRSHLLAGMRRINHATVSRALKVFSFSPQRHALNLRLI